jgi:hypothetical protein
MTLEKLESTLPNGLHDAEVQRITVDYEDRKLTLDLQIWVGDMDAPPEKREAYRKARIEISGLLFCVMEPPDPKYPYGTSDLRIDGCDMRKNLDAQLISSLPADSFLRSIWVDEWNAFIHIAARNAELAWTEDSVVIYR